MGTIKEWGRIRKEIKKTFEENEITYCELAFPKICMRNNFLSFAHRHKRIWYDMRINKDKNLLGSFNQVILACIACHDIIERNKELSDMMFEELRGKEENVEEDNE